MNALIDTPNTLQTVDFHGQTLLTFEHDGKHYVAMKPICENIGLAWNAQYERIQRDEVLSSTVRVIRIVAEDGKNREMICLPIEYLNGWLFGVDVKRIKPELRETIILYKKECYQVLNDYWRNGVAINPHFSTVEQRKPLRAAIASLVKRSGVSYSEAHRMVHTRFNIEHLEELTAGQILQAIEYVHGLILKAAFIEKTPKPLEPPKAKSIQLIIEM